MIPIVEDEVNAEDFVCCRFSAGDSPIEQTPPHPKSGVDNGRGVGVNRLLPPSQTTSFAGPSCRRPRAPCGKV